MEQKRDRSTVRHTKGQAGFLRRGLNVERAAMSRRDFMGYVESQSFPARPDDGAEERLEDARATDGAVGVVKRPRSGTQGGR